MLAVDERPLVALLCTGMTDDEMAARMKRRPAEVAAAIAAICERTRCSTRAELIARLFLDAP